MTAFIWVGRSRYWLTGSSSITMSTESGVDPFALLGVADDETDVDKVTSAFRSMVLLVHPDKGGSATDLKVVTCAYAFIKRAIQDRERADADFEAFCRTWKDDIQDIQEILDIPGLRNVSEERAQRAQAMQRFNEAFEGAQEVPVYLGPEGPDMGEAVSMAAGRGGHLGYTSEAIPLEPCRQLIEFNASDPLLRPSTRCRAGMSLDKYDYAEAYAPPAIDEPPQDDADRSATMAAFHRAMAQRNENFAPPLEAIAEEAS